MKGYMKEDVLIAFSGGVDSSLLLKLACMQAKETGKQVYAVFLHTMLHPAMEAENARVIARQMGARFETIEINELEQAGIMDNPKNRCYLCKKCLFKKVIEKAKEFGATYILEGTNEDDLHVYRPGIQAVKELGIKSPLAEAGMTKKEVRELASELELPVSNKPSMPCLVTRFPYGTHLEYREMEKVDAGEAFLRQLGCYNVRVRVHDTIARIEVDKTDFGRILDNQNVILQTFKRLGYSYITLDLEGFRSGSMDL